MKNRLNHRLLKFLSFGVLNTLIGLMLNFILFQLAGLGYWLSTSVSTVFCAVVSFLLNRSFTFRYKRDWLASFMRFAASQAVCYIIAYQAAQPLVVFALKVAKWSAVMPYVDPIAILVGMCLFTGMNYALQCMFVFTGENQEG